jgi:hypothetical protein
LGTNSQIASWPCQNRHIEVTPIISGAARKLITTAQNSSPLRRRVLPPISFELD